MRYDTSYLYTMETVTTRIPKEEKEIIEEMEQEMGADRSEVLRRLISQGVKKWRKERALKKLKNHEITIRKAAQIAGLDYTEMVSLASEKGIDTSGYSIENLNQDIEKI